MLVMLKVAMRSWMELAMPLLELRELPSHGFRAGFQAEEVHGDSQGLISKHVEWGASITICKLDIAKAYETLSWAAAQAMFEHRALPVHFQDAYWRIHGRRQLHLRTPEGAVKFTIRPTHGIPQGAPESPLV